MEMHTKPRTGQAMLFSSVGFLLLVFMVQTNGVSAVDCVDKPYGYPGCPLLESSSSASSAPDVSATCGNNKVDSGEECDMGRFNGERQCSLSCRLLFCGDEKLSPEIGEECEPKIEKFYAEDPETGELIVEKRYAPLTCGQEFYCLPPECEADGTCKGGCQQKRIEEWECPAEPVQKAAGAENSSAAAAPVLFVASSSRSPLCGNGAIDLGE